MKIIIFALALLAPCARAQTSPPPATPAVQSKPVPCWKQAGIAKPLMLQKNALAKATKASVQALCGDSSLAMPEKLKQIRTLQKASKQKIEALFPAEQLEALKKCELDRRGPAPAVKKGPCDQAP